MRRAIGAIKNFFWKRGKKKEEKRLEKIKSLITYFDSVRAGRLFPPKDLERKLAGSDKKDLKYAKRDLSKTMVSMKASPGFEKMIIVTNILQIICFEYFMIVLLLSMLYKIWGENVPPFAHSLEFLITPQVILFMFILLCLFWGFRRYVNRKIKKYKVRTMKIPGKDKRLQKTVQKYIETFTKEVKKSGADPEKHRIKLYHHDYEGIKIKSKPGILHDFYIAVVKHTAGKKAD